METSKKYNYLFNWIEKQQSVGNYVFDLEKLIREFPDQSESGILLALKRLAKKKRVVSVYKGFYLIVPPEYAARGILPPITFIDDLMSFIGKPYYVGLLSAAALHGAAHQQPQEFFVVTTTKQITTLKKGIKINYFTKGTIPEILVEKRKTESGYVNVSSAELTAADLVYYHNRIGGLNRVCTVINELVESISPKKINKDLVESMSTPTIQRLGIIFEKYVNRPDLGQKLLEVCHSNKRKFYIQPFKAGGEKKGFEINEKWKIILNTKIDLEE